MSIAAVIMARAPRAGETKTRLEPLLGAQGCARLQAELIRHTADWATRAAARTWLAFTPSDAQPEFLGLIPRAVRLFPQPDGDLGERMRRATECVFGAHRGAVAVLGTDAPELGPVHLRFVKQGLAAGHDACVTPTLDGGYALIALARPTPAAFELPSEAWGGPAVLELTLSALRAAGRSCVLLEPVRDLDTPEDARYVAADPRCPPAVGQALKPRSAA